MAIVELTEAQLKASQMLANGETQMNVAKIIGVNVKTIQRWLKDDLFKADVDKNVRLLKNKVEENISRNIEPIVDRLIEIALKSKSEKNSLDACIYAINKLTGTPTNKVQNITENDSNNDDVDMDKLLNEVSDNVIDISQTTKAK